MSQPSPAVSASPAGTPAPATPNSTGTPTGFTNHRTRLPWSAAEETKLVQVVKGLGMGRWKEVEARMHDEGFARQNGVYQSQYGLLKARAEAQGEPLNGPVALIPFTFEEDVKLLSLHALNAAVVAAGQQDKATISWPFYLPLFPRRSTRDLPLRMTTLKQRLKAKHTAPAYLQQVEATQQTAMKDIQALYPNLVVKPRAEVDTKPVLTASTSANRSHFPTPSPSLSQAGTFSQPPHSLDQSPVAPSPAPVVVSPASFLPPVASTSTASTLSAAAPPPPSLPPQPIPSAQSTPYPASPPSLVPSTLVAPSAAPKTSTTVEKERSTKRDSSVWDQGFAVLKRIRRVLEAKEDEEDAGE